LVIVGLHEATVAAIGCYGVVELGVVSWQRHDTTPNWRYNTQFSLLAFFVLCLGLCKWWHLYGTIGCAEHRRNRRQAIVGATVGATEVIMSIKSKLAGLI